MDITGIRALLFSALCILVGCSNESPDRNPIKLGLNIWPGYGAFFIAEERGFFANEGVNVELKIIQSDVEREAALLSGEIHGIGMTLDNLALLRSRGLDAQAIYRYDGSFGADGILIRGNDASVKNLLGKTVAWAPATTSHYFLASYLKKYNLSTNLVQHVAMGPDDAGAAFVAGSVDAAVTWEPWLSQGVEKGDAKVLVSTRDFPVIEDVLFLSTSVIDKRPQELQALLRACFDAVKYWNENPKEGSQIIARKLGIDVQDIEEMLGGIRIMSLQDNVDFFTQVNGTSPAEIAYSQALDVWNQEKVVSFDEAATSAINPTFIMGVNQLK